MATKRLKLIKQIPKPVRYLIFGVCRKTEKELSSIIPLMIQYFVLLYYYHHDYFSEAYKDYKISANKLTVSKMSGFELGSNIFCNKWYESMSNRIIKWTFYMNQMEYFCTFSLISQNNGLFRRYQEDRGTYTHFNSGGRSIDGRICSPGLSHSFFKTGDTISYILDLKSSEWIFRNKYGKEYVITKIRKSTDIKYKLVLSMSNVGDSITLKNVSWK